MRFSLGLLLAGVALAAAQPSAAQLRKDVYITGGGSTDRVNHFTVVAKIDADESASGNVYLNDAPGASTSHLSVKCGRRFDDNTAILGGVLQLTQTAAVFAFIGVRDTSIRDGGKDYRTQDEISDEFFITVNPSLPPEIQCKAIQRPLKMVKVVAGAVIFSDSRYLGPPPR